MLKRIVIYFFVLLFLTGGLLEKEMSKWDGYWRHFQYHVKRNPDYTFTRFVYVHFLDGEHDTWRKKRHRSFPFEKRMMQTANALYCKITQPSVSVFRAFVTLDIDTPYSDFIHKGFPDTPIKPPLA